MASITVGAASGTPAGVEVFTDPNNADARGNVVAVILSDGSLLGAAGLPAAVASNAYTSQPTVTRPANTTAYAAGDVVGGAVTFTSVGPSGGHVLFVGADLRADISAVPTGMTTFRLHLYDVTPPSALADNAAWDLPSGDRSAYLGYIDLGTVADLGSTCYTQATLPVTLAKAKLAAASTSLFGYLTTTVGFTPAANSEVYAPRLHTVGV